MEETNVGETATQKSATKDSGDDSEGKSVAASSSSQPRTTVEYFDEGLFKHGANRAIERLIDGTAPVFDGPACGPELLRSTQRILTQLMGAVTYADFLEDQNNYRLQSDQKEANVTRSKRRNTRRSHPRRISDTLDEELSDSPSSNRPEANSDIESNKKDKVPKLSKKTHDLSTTVKRLKAIRDPHDRDYLELYDDDEKFEYAWGIRAKKRYPIEFLVIYSRRRDFKSRRIVLNSESLTEYVERTVPQLPGSPLKRRKDDPIAIDEPFPQLFHYRHLLTEGLDSLHGDAREHLEALLSLLREQCAEISEVVDEIEKGSLVEIDYNQLWLLYPPGTIVYRRKQDEWEAFRVQRLHKLDADRSSQHKPLTLDLVAAGFDRTGTKLRSCYRRVTLSPYIGKSRVEDLQFIPDKYLPQRHKIETELYERGATFWSYRERSHYREYFGQAWPTQEKQEPIRVIIDYATSSKRPSWRRRRASRGSESGGESSDEEAAFRRPPSPPSHRSPRSSDDEGARESAKIFEANKKPDDLFLLCPSHMHAFSLRNKDWRKVKIRELRPVEFAQDAFKKLVIEKRYKAVVTAMVRSYLNEVGTFRDIVKGKGRGLVVLLHGAPGTGKTLTAECVAENEKRPLYMVTSGDLGTFADTLQDNLRTAFENAVNWNAVLLLDEADVFLQERDVQALDRNALVSVFLRELEYFNGVMFLTTNRPGLLDEAFHSRIHITLRLPDLTTDSRMRIWAIFVKDLNVDMKTKETLIRDIASELQDYSLNGRQIRNCMRAAIALARQEKAELSIKHLIDIVQIGRQFTDYMTDMNRMNLEQRAATLGIRLARTESDKFA